MKEKAQRAIEECRRIAAMTEEPGRITRRFLTPPMHDVHALLTARMRALGMAVHVDAAGNLRGLWRPAKGATRRIVLGSHVDTVPDAGAFDGVLGVALALEWVAIAREINFPLAVEVIAFSEEEGVRFGVPFIGSRAVAGRFDASLLALKDAEGVTVGESICAFGLDLSGIDASVADSSALAFIEVHIEQGPVLEAENLSVAAVAAIVGQTRMSLTFTGHANHAGTTPMHLRRDALAAAAEWIVAVEKIAKESGGLVATVGKIESVPNAGNVVPGSASVSLDVRHADDSKRIATVDALLAQANAIAERRGLTLTSKRQMDQPAVPMDERLTAFLAESLEASGFPGKRMPSGAGHDAMVMAARVPTAMLFLRSPGGVSHHPDEAVREEDVKASLHVAHKFLERLAAEFYKVG
jgi:allantoate deiminase